VAQCEAAYGSEFCHYWLLNNMVTIDGTKMGKSLGNTLNIQQAITGQHPRLSQPYAPLAIRFFILSSHYRQNTDFTDEALKSAAKGHERLLATVGRVRQQLDKAPAGDPDAEFAATIDQFKARFVEAMDNDFNTPQALAALFDFNRAVNGLVNGSERLQPPRWRPSTRPTAPVAARCWALSRTPFRRAAGLRPAWKMSWCGFS
jgi:cysteinyl-tRNA synthetase